MLYHSKKIVFLTCWLILAGLPVYAITINLPDNYVTSKANTFALKELNNVCLSETVTVNLHVTGETIPCGESYHLLSRRKNDSIVVDIKAADTAGQVYALLHLMREIRQGGKCPDNMDVTVTPALSLRMVDVETPFYPPEPRPERPYWLGSYRRMYDIEASPYIDLDRFNQIETRFERFCQISLINGYNSLLFVVTDNRMVDPGIWDVTSISAAEAERLCYWRRLYARTLNIAEDYGLKNYVWLSEVTFPEEVMTVLRREGVIESNGRSAHADITHPALYRALEKKYQYLTETYPQIDGFLVRVGELGGGEIGAKAFGGNFEAIRDWSIPQHVGYFWGEMEKLIAGKLHKEFIARSWWTAHPSIHTDPGMLAQAVSRLNNPKTWLCIKNTHEFWGNLPLNPAVAANAAPVIIEYQGCREYDGMGSHPVTVINHMANRFKQTPTVKGIWTWVKLGGSGGWYRLPYFYGFEDWTEANVYAAGRLAWDPALDADVLRHEFAVLKVGRQVADDYAKLLKLGEIARDKGLYVKCIGDENPWHPMFPTYRNYFYAGDIIAHEDKVRTDDPIAYIFDHYRNYRNEMSRDMDVALAARQESFEIARRIAGHVDSDYGAALVKNVRHGLLLQEVLTQWIKTAGAYYEWIDAGRPYEQIPVLERLNAELLEKRRNYDAEYGEYIDRDYGMRGFIERMKKDLASFRKTAS